MSASEGARFGRGFRRKSAGKVPKRYTFGTEAFRNCLMCGSFRGMPKRAVLGKTPAISLTETQLEVQHHGARPGNGAH